MTHSTARGYGLVEISARGVDKGAMLARVCARMGIDAADVAAFGDMPNDLSMLSWVGQPYVVANAHPALLAQGFADRAAQLRVGGRADHPPTARLSPMGEVMARIGRGVAICLLPVLMALWVGATTLPRRHGPPVAARDGRPRRLPAGRPGAARRRELLPAARPAAVPLPSVRRPAGGPAGGAARRAGPDQLDRRRCPDDRRPPAPVGADRLAAEPVVDGGGVRGRAGQPDPRVRSARHRPGGSGGPRSRPRPAGAPRPPAAARGGADRGGRGAEADPDDLRALPAGGASLASRPDRDDHRRSAHRAGRDHPAAGVAGLLGPARPRRHGPRPQPHLLHEPVGVRRLRPRVHARPRRHRAGSAGQCGGGGPGGVGGRRLAPRRRGPVRGRALRGGQPAGVAGLLAAPLRLGRAAGVQPGRAGRAPAAGRLPTWLIVSAGCSSAG